MQIPARRSRRPETQRRARMSESCPEAARAMRSERRRDLVSETATVPATIPTRLPRRSARDLTSLQFTRHDQAKLSAGIWDAPGDLARRARVTEAGRSQGHSDLPAGSAMNTRHCAHQWNSIVRSRMRPTCSITATSSPCGVPSGALPVRGIDAGKAQTVKTLDDEVATAISTSVLARLSAYWKRRPAMRTDQASG